MSERLNSVFSWITVIVVAAVLGAFPLISQAAESLQLPDGSKVDLAQKCPICGMAIGGKEGEGVTVTYKDGRVVAFHGVAAAVFKDGHVVGFEGARCLFIYNSVPEKYNASVADIAHQYVTDYTSKKMIELPKAFLVLGSEVKGPMGYDLIAFSNKEEAAKFASENDGKWIVQLHEISRTVPSGAEKPVPVEQGESFRPDETTAPAPLAKPETIEPQQVPVVKERRLPPSRTREFDPYDPSVGPGSGHHGGGHMH